MFIGLDIPILRLKDIAPAALQRLEPPPEGFRLRRPTYAVGLQQVNDLHHTISGLRHSDTLRLAAGLFTPSGYIPRPEGRF